METIIQSVIKKVSEVTLKVAKNIEMQVAAIIMTRGRKNYASMARENNISYNDLIVKKKNIEDDIFSCSQFLIDNNCNLSKLTKRNIRSSKFYTQ